MEAALTLPEYLFLAMAGVEGRCCEVPFGPSEAEWCRMFHGTPEQWDWLMEQDPWPQLVGFALDEDLHDIRINDVIACSREGRVAVFRWRVWALLEAQAEGSV
jgi:hypothetical protein